MEVLDDKRFALKFKVAVDQSDIVLKLTECMYGIAWVDDNGSLDLSKTTGPYSLQASSPTNMTLAVNAYSRRYSPDLFPAIEIKSAQLVSDAVGEFLKDDWSMVQSSSSMVAGSEQVRSRKDISVVPLNLTRSFLLTPNPQLATSDHYGLLNYLRGSLSRERLLKGIIGVRPTEQLFPTGSQLRSNKQLPPSPTARGVDIWNQDTIRILILDERVPQELRSNLKN